MSGEREIRETIPSLTLAIAGALARAGWPPDRVADELDLPPAFAELLCRSAVRDGERNPGDDARLLAALSRKIESRRPKQRRDNACRGTVEPFRLRPSVSRGLLVWNLCVLLLTVASLFRSVIPGAARPVLLVAALAGLPVTIRQATRACRGSHQLGHHRPPARPPSDLDIPGGD